MKTVTSRATVILIALSAFATGTTFANNIGASFVGRPQTFLAPGEVAGVVPQANWNNISSDPFTGTAVSLTDDAGNFTAVTLIYAANDSWNSDGPTVTPNDKLMKGVMKARFPGDTATYTLTSVPAGTYDVYVYTIANGAGAKPDTTIGATTYYTTEQNVFVGSFIQAVNTVNDDPSRDLGNYVKFTGVSPVSGEIVITSTHQGGADGSGTAGIQLVGTGTYPPNTMMVSITTQPANQRTGVGGTATFRVAADVPARFQWFKNDVLISGANSATYTTPPATLADNNSTFHVVVSNNVNSVPSDDAVLTVSECDVSNGLLNDTSTSSQALPTPTGWTVVATRASSGPYNDGASSEGFANADIPDPTPDPNAFGLFFKPFQGTDPNNRTTVHFYQDISGTPGMKYILTAYAGAEAGYSGLIAEGVTKSELAVEFLDAGTNVIGGATNDLRAAGLGTGPGERGYAQYMVMATAPAGTVSVRARASMIDAFNTSGSQAFVVDVFEMSCAPDPDAPRLTITRSGAEVVVSWSTSLAPNTTLQSATSLSKPINWVDDPRQPTVVGNENQLRYPTSQAMQFYRLQTIANDANAAANPAGCAAACRFVQGNLEAECGSGGNGVWSQPVAGAIGYVLRNLGDCPAQADVAGPGGVGMVPIPAGAGRGMPGDPPPVVGGSPATTSMTISCFGAPPDDCLIRYTVAY